MVRMIRTGAAATVAAAALMIGGARAASAQDLSWASAFEADGNEVYVVFTQPSLTFGTGTVRPSIMLGAYHVWTPGEDTWGLTPAAGLGYYTSGGLIKGTLGWAVRDDDNGNEVDVFGGSNNGLHTGIQTEFWGDGEWGLQGLASYNWGSDFLWSRARVARRIMQSSSGGSTSLGAELGWQTVADDGDLIDDNEYEATMIGPVLLFNRPSGMSWALGAGVKLTEPGPDDSTWYAKVEMNLP